MADVSDGSRSKKRKKSVPRRKLVPGEKVEVLYTDEGLNGSWHSGVVIDFGQSSRIIEYIDLLSEDNCSKLVESVPVSAAIEGLTKTTLKNHRGHIRPSPPHYEFQESEIRYGLCVDALVDDAWWEGVVFDREEGSAERLIFFPDQGDQQMITVDRLRLTQVWNEVSGIWRPRGVWLLLQVLRTFEQDETLPVSIREIWYDLRTMADFGENIGVWTFGSQSSWFCLVSELIQELLSVVHGLLVGNGNSSNKLIDVHMNFSDVGIPMEDFPCLEGTNRSIDSAGKPTGLADSSSQRKDANRNCCRGATKNKVVVTPMGGVCGKGDLPLSGCSESNHKQGFYPQALSDFISEYHSRFTHRRPHTSERFDVTREMAMCHLLAVGWKLKVSDFGHKYYVSPEGKQYKSFITACEACEQIEFQTTVKLMICNEQGGTEADNISAHEEYKVDGRTNSGFTKSWQPLDLEAAYCPEAVKLCAYSLIDKRTRLKKAEAVDVDHTLVRLRAKKHLLALGWEISCRRDGLLRYSFVSPEGKRHYSLLKACRYLLMGHQKKDRKSSGGNTYEPVSLGHSCPTKKNKPRIEHANHAFGLSMAVGDNMLKHASHRSCSFQKSKKLKAHKPLIKEVHKTGCSFSQRSCKRSRKVVPNPTHHVARTVLSLLIDNDMVLPRQKVSYIRKRDGYVMMQGRVTRDGIKCMCCKKVYTLTNFEAHAGSTNHRPAANIILQDGRSLLDCQMQMVQGKKPKDLPHGRLKSDCSIYQSDTICSVCHDGGILVLCDHCPSSFHLGCVGLEDVPKGKWFCPSCRCGICGMSEFNSHTEQFTDQTVLYCDQCEREYHVGCLKESGLTTLRNCPVGNWFCSKKCSKIFLHLRKILGKSNPTSREGLSWTILRSSRENGVGCDQFDAETTAEHDSKLCVALDVLHECFVAIIEPRTKTDLIADLLFNKESELKRLNFWGFYTMLLEKGDELISVATFRVYGDKVAEMPLVGTRVQYRRQGMCRLLVNELEKLLSALGVERLMLPAVPQLLPTWMNSFGFTKMSSSDRSDFLQYSLLNFQDTTMCQKLVRTAPIVRKKPIGNSNQLRVRSSIEEVDSDMCSVVSEVLKMVEPIKTLPSLSTGACSTSSFTDLVGKRVLAEMNEQTSPNVAPGKRRESSGLIETSRTAVVKPSTNLDFKFLEKCYGRVGKADTGREHLDRSLVVRDESTFKYFYRRRISAN